MKKIVLLLLGFSALLTGCKDASSLLDREDIGDLYDKDVFRNPAYADFFVNDIYLRLPGGGYEYTSGWGGAYLDCATDNGEARSLSSHAQKYNNGYWDANDTFMGSSWAKDYAQIRSCNQFLTHYELIEPNDEDGLGYSRQDLELLKAQVYFLRAYHYYDLLLKHGGVPIVGDQVFQENDPGLKEPRATFARTVDYIVGECDRAAALFRGFADKTKEPTYYGRATEGMALTLKAKTLALAASPLYNRPADYPQYDAGDPNVGLWRYPDYERERWKTAADALRAVIDLGIYDLWQTAEDSKSAYETYFTKRATGIETIFPILRGPNDSIYFCNLPFEFMLVGGKSPVCYNLPTANLVNAYEMKNGMLTQQEGSGFRPLQPFRDRDPRLEATIWHDGSTFCGIEFETWRRETTSEKFKGKHYITGYSRTGFFLRKYMDVDQNPTNNGSLPNCYPLFRFADVLLLYAECLNEYHDHPTQAPEDGIRRSFDRVRERAGMPGIDETFANRGWELNQQTMRQQLQNERRVEFAFEEHRFWDIRRWMIGAQTQTSVSELDIVLRDDDKTKIYTEVEIEKRAWENRMYHIPIPQGEINKNKDLIQNWGWSPKSI